MTDYSNLKVTDLKELLKERQIPSTGLTRKQQYIEALQREDAHEAAGDSPPRYPPNGCVDPPYQAHSTLSPQLVGTPYGTANDAPPEFVKAEKKEPVKDVEVEENGKLPVLASTVPEEPSPDSRKRKRRSPTPSEAEDSVQKKLKAADEEAIPKLPEDVKEDAHVSMDDTAEETVRPMEVADDVVKAPAESEFKHEDIETAAEDSEAMIKDEGTPPDAIDEDVKPPAIQDDGPASLHPPTSALYIRNLLRPLQIQNLKDHLLTLATPSDQPLDSSIITSIHLDSYKSHAFVSFTSPTHASRARSLLHSTIWPSETQRKPLWVDYIPASLVAEWSATEDSAGKNRRFEIVYTPSDATGTAAATLEEVTTGSSFHPSANAVPGPGMPNAPTGPRGDRGKPPAPATPTIPDSTRKALAPDTVHLESLFRHTTAEPKIFYQPVDAEMVTKRLDELDRESARGWNGGRQRPVGGMLDQLKRYTFEDGDVLVDGGADFGGFGKERGAGGGGGVPVGGGGGFRGGRGGGRGRGFGRDGFRGRRYP